MDLVGRSIFFLGIFSAFIEANSSGKSSDFTAFVDQYWDWRMKQSPEFSTKAGTHLYNDRWQTLTEETFTEDKNKAEEFLAASRMVEISNLEKQDKVTLKIVQTTLESYVSGFKYRKFSQYNPVAPFGNPLTNWEKIINLMPLETLRDYDNLIHRYRGIATQVTEIIGLLREAIRLNTTHHASSLTGTRERIEGVLASVTDGSSYLQKPLSRMPDEFSDEQRSNITQTMNSAINDVIIPAVRRFGDFFEKEYSQNTRPLPGVYSFPDGQDYYQECLKWHLGLSLTAQEVHDIGIGEVQRIEDNIKQLMVVDNSTGTLHEYLTYLKAQPENYYTTETEMLDEYRRIIATTHQQLGSILPVVHDDCPVIVQQEMNPQSWARYSSPVPNKSIPGRFIINVFNPETRITFGMTSLTLHEVEPGHHTQECYTLSRGGKRKGRTVAFRKYYAIPFNFPFFTAFSEGWALYAESLGEEMGVYDTSNKLLGRYLNEIFRAVRLVVDTGIHSLGWTKEHAIEYIKKYSTRSDSDIMNEVNRYITWPGQACSYKIGEIKIRELRTKAETILGDRFDKRYFHDAVLQFGSLPLSVLEEQIDEWIETVADSGSVTLTTCTQLWVVLACVLSYLAC